MYKIRGKKPQNHDHVTITGVKVIQVFGAFGQAFRDF